MAKRKTFLVCSRCGTSTVHTLHCSIESDVEHYDGGGDRIHEPARYSVFNCDGCTRVSLYIWSAINSPGSEFGEVLYPAVEQELSGVPPNVQSAYLQAEAVKTHSATAYAILARRVLEAIAIERGVTERNLSRAMSILVAKGEIPALLAEASTLIRLFGNQAAHESGETINWIHVQMIQKFLCALIEHVYVAPAALEEFKWYLDLNDQAESPIGQ